MKPGHRNSKTRHDLANSQKNDQAKRPYKPGMGGVLGIRNNMGPGIKKSKKSFGGKKRTHSHNKAKKSKSRTYDSSSKKSNSSSG